MNRVCLFAHYDRDNKVDPYVLYYLKELKQLTSAIIFVSTSNLPPPEIKKLDDLVDQIILKENKGYDFGSWAAGISLIELDKIDELLICNDSCYGPFNPLVSIFNKMESKPADFWGMTVNRQIYPHIQSYFVVFKKQVINHPEFKKFWTEIEHQPNKKDTIIFYEIGLTKKLADLGFKYSAAIQAIPKLSIFVAGEYIKLIMCQPVLAFFASKSAPTTKLLTFWLRLTRKIQINSTHNFWRVLLQNGMPFVKIELLRDNPLRINIKDYDRTLRNYSDHATQLAESHLKRVKNRQ